MSSSPIIRGSGTLTPQPSSPEWEFGETTTCVKTYRGTHADCLAARPLNGAYGLGDVLGLRVKSSKVTRQNLATGTLEIRFEGALAADSQALPDSQASIDIAKQEFALEKHPNYEALTEDQIDAVRAFVSARNDADRQLYEGVVAASAVATELAEKLKRGQTHFILFVPVYKWVIHTWSEPALNGGGDIEAPYGPITAPTGLDWLRQGDQAEWNGKTWALTRSWIASYEWDPDIYPVP